MPEDITALRDRFIKSVFLLNHLCLEGPDSPEPDRILYLAGEEGKPPAHPPRVRIAFQKTFLSDPKSEFVTITLQALRRAILQLRGGGRPPGGPGAEITVSEKGVFVAPPREGAPRTAPP